MGLKKLYISLLFAATVSLSSAQANETSTNVTSTNETSTNETSTNETSTNDTPTTETNPAVYAKCVFNKSIFGEVNGELQLKEDTAKGITTISGLLTGLNVRRRFRGFHVHENGDISNNCSGVGGHYNPLGKNHGPHKIPNKVEIPDKVFDPTTNSTVDVIRTVDMDPVLNDGSKTERHVGDLGNIDAAMHPQLFVSVADTLVKLTGDHSVIGKSLVIHVGEDDEGLQVNTDDMDGNTNPALVASNAEALVSGNSGPAAGCCLIEPDAGPSTPPPTQNLPPTTGWPVDRPKPTIAPSQAQSLTAASGLGTLVAALLSGLVVL